MLRLVLVAHAAQCLAFTSVSTGLRRHAYGSPAAAQRGRAAAATTQRRAVPMAIALPAPASKLMALVGTALEPPAPSAPKIEGSKLFRLLGIPPEAEYDEIQAAYVRRERRALACRTATIPNAAPATATTPKLTPSPRLSGIASSRSSTRGT
jgi:hypothetical protein